MSSQDDFQSPKQPTAPARTVRPPILDESDSSDDDVPLSTFKRNTSPQKAAPAASSKPPKKVFTSIWGKLVNLMGIPLKCELNVVSCHGMWLSKETLNH